MSWGAEVAQRAANASTKERIAGKLPTRVATKRENRSVDASLDYHRRAHRKFTTLLERSNAGEKISPMRPRAFAPLEHSLPGYGGRTGSNWEFNGNKRVRKSMGGRLVPTISKSDVTKGLPSALKAAQRAGGGPLEYGAGMSLKGTKSSVKINNRLASHQEGRARGRLIARTKQAS